MDLVLVAPIAWKMGLVIASAFQVIPKLLLEFALNVDISFRRTKSSIHSSKALIVL